MQNGKLWGRRILSLCCIAVGMTLLFYPVIRELLNQYETGSKAEAYRSRVTETGDSGVRELWSAAVRYNQKLSESAAVLTDPFLSAPDAEDTDDYESVLALDAEGLMGFLEIPSIHVWLPVYHGTDAETLEKGIGHLEGSSLPVGGTGTHAVLSGHTGLRGARMFTDLDELETGDIFRIHILDQVLTYQIRETAVVLPSDVSRLVIRPGQDLCTLVTCTPYGINSHRLLVTGERTETADEDAYAAGEKESGDMTGKDKFRKWLIWSIGLTAGLLLILYPVFADLRFRLQSGSCISAQKLQFGEPPGDGQQDNAPEEQITAAEVLYEEAEAYNAFLVSEGQNEIGNPQEIGRLSLLADQTEKYGFGFIRIPVMDIELPLFYGASSGHLSRGAAVLEGTSIPLGETSSNTVIAGHRGYRGIPFFREIEKLKRGDKVYVSVPWGFFIYRVDEIRIIQPYDTGALEIRQGEDRLTLLTCHPYLSGGKYRYVVYCLRDTASEGTESEEEDSAEYGESVLLKWKDCTESRKLILGEKISRILGVCGIGILFAAKIKRERRSVRET